MTDKYGEQIVYKNKHCIGDPQTTAFTFGFEELMDPARFQSGSLTIFGHGGITEIEIFTALLTN